MSETFQVGDTVRIKDPLCFISSFAKKVADRDAVVEQVGPTRQDMFKGKAFVRFLKRNNRGKEFTQWISMRDLVIVNKKEES